MDHTQSHSPLLVVRGRSLASRSRWFLEPKLHEEFKTCSRHGGSHARTGSVSGLQFLPRRRSW